MPVAPIFQDLIARDVPLTSIFLDPNNPRFVGPSWQRIEDNDIDKEPVQENARMLLIKNYGVEKLRMNMEVNGYLPIDRVIVRKFKDDKFVVLEGNRRNLCGEDACSNWNGWQRSQRGSSVLSKGHSLP